MPVKKKQPSSAYTLHNKVKLVRAGTAYFSLLHKMIEGAKEIIHLQLYILEEDETGQKVVEALLAATKKGVKVYLMADAYASHSLSKQFVKKIEDGGINFRFFQPFFKSRYFYIGRRMHHKLFVADAKYCLVGGINIGDRYNDMPEQKAWLDFALYAEGEIAREICQLAVKMWKGFAGTTRIPACKAAGEHFTFSPEECSEVMMRRNDWVSSKMEISKTYKEMFATASSHITILCSYFMPGNLMKKNILRATKKGVRIRVIMAGRSDIALAKNAERFMYDWLLRNKVEIYEYNKNILHGKLAVCDDKWMTIGSYNINNISAYASIELNLDIKNIALAKHTMGILEEIIANDCVPVTKEDVRKSRNIFKQFAHWCSYEFIRVMFFLFTFYFKQRKGE